ncbi:MAG: hypothetical protein WCC57_20715 [Paracoccaceae bacterium]
MGLSVNVNKTGLCLGDAAQVRLLSDGQIGIFAIVTKRLLWLFPRKVSVFLGHLGPAAASIISPALRHGDPLRVRIVGLNPEHLAKKEGAEVHISIWGDLKHVIAPAAPAFFKRDADDSAQFD